MTEKINGVEYIFVSYSFINQSTIDEFMELMKKYKGFIQITEIIKGTQYIKSHMKISALVPVKNITDFYCEFSKQPL